ncbi:PH domain-containing protein [Thiocapsa sp.]|uniref:PH domain-containing protein n=1 Tax=Thiocapsa sp. TaxID=2024551 RepID=UPI00262DB353|nr:PH domain-containing protein [Thiocapsa sp.]
MPSPQESLSRIEAKNRPDRQSKKVEYLSIPYKSVVRFSVTSAGHFDLDAEPKLRTSGMSTPVQKTFSTAVNLYEVQALLAEYVGCRG